MTDLDERVVGARQARRRAAAATARRAASPYRRGARGCLVLGAQPGGLQDLDPEIRGAVAGIATPDSTGRTRQNGQTSRTGAVSGPRGTTGCAGIRRLWAPDPDLMGAPCVGAERGDGPLAAQPTVHHRFLDRVSASWAAPDGERSVDSGP